MPQTLNGIGTAYYGKKNIKKDVGTCEQCGWTGQLLSYETIYWFVIVYIPIIPLGRKQLLDYCPKCTHHRSLPLKAWSELKQEAVSTSLNEIKGNPNDPETGIQTLSTLIAFHETEKAQKLADILDEKHKNNVDVQMKLLGFYEMNGQTEKADACMINASTADPENLSVRRAIGISCIESGDSEKARHHLSFMEDAGPDQDPAVLFMLVQLYAQQQNYTSAIDIVTIISRDFPEIARKDKTFRKAVSSIEKMLQRTDSVLPSRHPVPTRASRIKATIAAVIAICVLIGGYFFQKYNQKLYIINQTASTAIVSFPDRETIRVPKESQTKIILPEGKYTATIQSAIMPRETVEFNFSNAWYNVFNSRTAKIINVGGGAVLYWQKTTYSENPLPTKDQYQLNIGDRYVEFHDIDYIFEEFPEKLSVEEGKSIDKTRLSILKYQVWDLLDILEEEKIPADKVLSFIEGHLSADPNNTYLLNAYSQRTMTDTLADRRMGFLKKGLQSKPLPVEWHRTYQSFEIANDNRTNLVALYDSMLANEPENSNLLYLRGRIGQGYEQSQPYYNRSIKADTSNPYPLNAKAYRLFRTGKPEDAFSYAKKACGLENATEHMHDQYFSIQFALGKFDRIEKEAQEELKTYPLNWQSFSRIMAIKTIQKNSDGVKTELKKFQEAVAKNDPEDKIQYALHSQLLEKYLKKDFNGLIQKAPLLNNRPSQSYYLFQAYLNNGHFKKAEKIIRDENMIDGYRSLLLWMESKRINNTRAAPWMKEAIRFFDQGSREEKTVADLLRNPGNAPCSMLNNISLDPNEKRIVYTTFAMLAPNDAACLKKRAAALNVYPSFPYHYLKRIGAQL